MDWVAFCLGFVVGMILSLVGTIGLMVGLADRYR